MTRIFHPLLAMIASGTDRQLAKYVEYLKAENRILRARIPGQIHTRVAERKVLLKFGKNQGRAIEELITIVTPTTFYRWCREGAGKKAPAKQKGGQRKPRELRQLVIEIANSTGFGYTRIIGELRKPGIRKISRQTVRNILKDEGIEPGPKRRTDSWNDFIERHGKTLWACDFFTTKTVTARGLRDMYLLVFLCLETREVIVSESTLHPNSVWMHKQADALIDQTANRESKPARLIHDRDTKFCKAFVDKLAAGNIQTIKLPKLSPNLNGRCERFILTIMYELLAHFVVFGKRHLDYLICEFVDYYNGIRSHSSRDCLPPVSTIPVEIDSLNVEQVTRKTHVGGLITSFESKAAA
ncbi:MAG: integrase core domain-containing protein [Planctomycetaceae bacterium]